MKVGIGSWTYGWSIGVRGYPPPAKPLTPIDLLRRAHAYGLGVVQIADNLPLHTLSRPALEELKTLADEWNIEIEIGTASVRPDHLIRYLDLAKCLRARLVRSLIGEVEAVSNLPQATAWLKQVLPAFEAAGVCLALENYEAYTSAQLSGLVRDLSSPNLGICLDTVNSLGALETPVMVVEQLGPYVRSLHIKDFAITRAESKMGFIVAGRPAGEGMLNIDWLLGELRRLGSDPNLILEMWTPYRGSVEDTIKLEEEWADRSVRFLKRYAC